MKIAISGASGLLGTHLSRYLRQRGDEVVPIVRTRDAEGILWDPYSGTIDSAKLNGADAVVNLAGESIAERWSDEKKRLIMDSRVKGTALLARTIASLEQRPRVFVCASAIGYYGDRADEILRETSDSGTNFLSDVVRQWEAAAQPAEHAGVRVVNLRFGIILSTRGGALAKMLRPFQMGVGGRLGTGQQYMSWIAIDDAARAVEFAIETAALRGPVNVVAPSPVNNIEFTRAMGRVLHRPTFMPVPVKMAHMAFGTEMADQVLLASNRVVPEKLKAAGFRWEYPNLEDALAHVISEHV